VVKKKPFVSRFAQTNVWRWTRPSLPHLILALFFLFFTLGCSLLNRNAEPPAVEEQAVTQLTLVCSDECARRGQCGQTTDGRSVILGHPERPVVTGHQMIFAADAAFPMVGTSNQRLQIMATSEQFDHTFYLLTRPEDGRSGWVAGWCVVP
jgi:hypothetical protein